MQVCALHNVFLLFVCLSALFVCMFVCVHDISKSWGRIWMKFGEPIKHVTGTNWLDFGEDPVPDLATIIF